MIFYSEIQKQLCFFEHIPIIRNISSNNYVFLTQYILSFRRSFSVKTLKFPETLSTISRSGPTIKQNPKISVTPLLTPT